MSRIESFECNICLNTAALCANKDGFSLYKCLGCDNVFVHPQPAFEELATQVYSGTVGYHAEKVCDISLLPVSKDFARVLDYMDTVNSNQSSLNICDIGASNGEFLFAAKQRGYIPFGVELNESTAAVANSNGLNVAVGTFDKAGFAQDQFNFVHMGDVLEHVPDPRGLLKQVHSKLALDGEIIISTPNLDCLWAEYTQSLYKICRIPISSFTPPQHLFQFSVNNLKLLLEQTGFEVVTHWYGTPPSLEYELGAMHLVRRIKKSQGINKAALIAYALFAFTLYTLGYAVVSALRLMGILKKDFTVVMVARAVK